MVPEAQAVALAAKRGEPGEAVVGGFVVGDRLVADLRIRRELKPPDRDERDLGRESAESDQAFACEEARCETRDEEQSDLPSRRSSLSSGRLGRT